MRQMYFGSSIFALIVCNIIWEKSLIMHYISIGRPIPTVCKLYIGMETHSDEHNYHVYNRNSLSLDLTDHLYYSKG